MNRRLASVLQPGGPGLVSAIPATALFPVLLLGLLKPALRLTRGHPR